MNSKFNLIFVCFIINLINVFNVFTVIANTILARPVHHFDNVELATEASKWKDGRFYFKLDETVNGDEMNRIVAVMYEIEKKSCIRFAAHNPNYSPDYVMIKKDYTNCTDGFASDLGCRHQGEQLLTFAASSMHELQTILYGILRVIGINYRRQRSDRTTYSGLSDYDKIMLNDLYGCANVKEGSKIFYETQINNVHATFVNDREMQRAQQYFEDRLLGDSHLANNEAHDDENRAENELHDDEEFLMLSNGRVV